MNLIIKKDKELVPLIGSGKFFGDKKKKVFRFDIAALTCKKA
jgi:hypothetical protein